jgi:hypothetical protein
LWEELSWQIDEGKPSEALVVELLKFYQDVGHRLAAVDRRLVRLSRMSQTSTISRIFSRVVSCVVSRVGGRAVSNTPDREKKVQ